MRKQIVIASIYLVLWAVLGSGIYLLARPDETCFDGVRNQNEQGIDCGGICARACAMPPPREKLQVTEKHLLAVGEGTFDAVALLENKNPYDGIREFVYTWRLRRGGEIIGEHRGQTFVLPRSKRYLIDRVSSNAEVSRTDRIEVELVRHSIEWQHVADEYEEPSLTEQARFEATPGDPTGKSRVIGSVINNSDYDLQGVQVNVVIRTTSGDIIAVGKTQMNTVKAGELRDFRITFTESLEGVAAEIYKEALTNVFDNNNFLKRYGMREKFTEFIE